MKKTSDTFWYLLIIANAHVAADNIVAGVAFLIIAFLKLTLDYKRSNANG